MTHPTSEHRKRALFAALERFDGNPLEGRISKVDLSNRFEHYDPKHLSPALVYAGEVVKRNNG